MLICVSTYRLHGNSEGRKKSVARAFHLLLPAVIFLLVCIGTNAQVENTEVPGPSLSQGDKYDAPDKPESDSVFDMIVSLPRQSASIYSVLNQIGGQVGYFFVYDTEIVDSDQRIRIRAGNKPVSLWLEEVLDDPSLDYRIIEQHILIYRPDIEVPEYSIAGKEEAPAKEEVVIVRGRVLDEETRDPLSFATVGIKGGSIGIISNSDGFFSLRVPPGYADRDISVTHLGYRTRTLPVRVFSDNRVDILMKTEYISIPEVMIRYFDPNGIVRSAISRIDHNYSNKPVYMLNFYREGVMRGSRFINYSEAFFQVYKSPHHNRFEQDQVKLLQSRSISNIDRSDTLILKIRAGIKSSLELDFIKNVPDFLNPEFLYEYKFTRSDIVAFDGRMAYGVAFEQREHINEPLFKGVLYIDIESLAFLGAEFEVNPKYISKAHERFIARRNRDYRATIDKAHYTVSYRYHDGFYYLNHVRADLHLRYRRRFSLFGSNYHVFVEMANSRIDTGDVERFRRREALRTDRVFMDGGHAYDSDFWDGYSIIPPEKRITDALANIESRIERVVAGSD
ncbi:MAG: hypothetical protein EA408_10160 [Marinilabiliales bacterium]|nr:MAG: hypothetical protein EA408_10160 [Marinilabiliales bacterium]